MAFRETQFGRLGNVMLNHFRLRPSAEDPDQKAANLYSINGVLGTNRPYVDQILRSKGMWDYQSSVDWFAWSAQFRYLRSRYPNTVVPLSAECTGALAIAPGECWHELIPPMAYY